MEVVNSLEISLPIGTLLPLMRKGW